MWPLVLLLVVLAEIIASLLTCLWQREEYPLVVTQGTIDILNNPFRPLFWARGKFVQTLLNRTIHFFYKRPFTRTTITLTDGTRIALDIKEQPHSKHILFFCHGLCGCSDNPFIHAIADKLPQFRTIVYNRNGHGKTPIHTKFPKHVDITDMQEVLAFIQKTYPNETIIGVGISAGANLLIRYAGEMETHPFKALVSVSNGNCLDTVSLNLDWLSNKIIIHDLHTMLKEHKNSLQNISKTPLDWSKLTRTKSIREFDQSLLVPLYQFKNVKEYYDNCSSYKYYEHIKVPLFSLSALDDPLIIEPLHYYPLKAALTNPCIVAIVTKQGGHMGWIDRLGHSWGVDRVVEFIDEIITPTT
jgi:uncharacterized protein